MLDFLGARLSAGWASLACSLLLVGCHQSGPVHKVTLRIKGSDTMLNLAQAWAEDYKRVAPDVEVEVSGGGSAAGIPALVKGTIDLYNATLKLSPEQVEQLSKITGKEPKAVVAGYEAIAFYVHPSNPLNEISLDELAQIYAEGGSITRWSELGVKIPGTDGDKIVRVSRQPNSGAYEFLGEQVLKQKNFKLGSLDMDGAKEVIELVASTPAAIGYSGLGYATPAVKALKVKKTGDDPAYDPSVAATLAKTYPLARPLLVYTLGEPQGAAKAYSSGFYPLPAKRSSRPAAMCRSNPRARGESAHGGRTSVASLKPCL